MGSTCSRCKKQLKGKDLERFHKYKEDVAFFKYQPNMPKIPFYLAEIFDYRHSIFYCQECISQVEIWGEEDKHCITCEFLMMNITVLPGVPHIYCRHHDNKAVYESKEESCKDWRLAYMFEK